MFRTASTYLEQNWIIGKDRKPLVVRGARQVGKTWLVRELSKNTEKKLIEINFERDPEIRSLFDDNNPKSILQNLEVYLGTKITPASSLLFLDEIQEAPEILAKLRWFYEETPELSVVAAGSLLEFTLQSHSGSMPVGRITYLHLEPLSFEEFLCAQGLETLLDYIRKITLPFAIPIAIHQSLQNHFRRYLQIGGMPAAVSRWIDDQSIESIMILQQDLLSTYRDDFFKYKGRIDVQRLDTLLKAIPSQLGEKFVCSKADPSIQSSAAKQILSLFNKARLCHVVQNSSGNGVPLAAEVKDKAFKQIFLDTGLANRFLGTNFSFSKTTIEGGISEQVVGQMLRCLFPFYQEPALYYWRREEKGSSAEIDYLLEHKDHIIPIEVKSGSTGSLKSLHFFMNLKHLSLAVRINNDLPSVTPVAVKNTDKAETSYTLLSIPFYLTGQIHRLLNDLG
ncbi:MAG: AAA family ATPase [Alphaproteobacteria bacterium]|nr:AAA family ATPase [Alphaproteobacteria bacterium]